MRKIFSSNILLMIISLIAAIVLWTYIIVINDAPADKTFRDVPITTVNDNVFSDNGYCIERLSVLGANVRIEGSRRVMSNFDLGNIRATLDFSEIDPSKLEDGATMTVNLNVESQYGDVVSYTPSAVDVYVETTKYKDVDVNCSSTGEVLSGYRHGDFTLSQNNIRIFGARSNIDEVAYAGVNIDLINTNYSAYDQGVLSQECAVKLYNSSGQELPEREIRRIWNSNPEITAECLLYKEKTVPVVPNRDGTLQGVTLSCDPETVTLYGDNSRLSEAVNILTQPITMNDFEKTGEVTVKLNLPSWAKTVDDVTEVKISADNNQ